MDGASCAPACCSVVFQEYEDLLIDRKVLTDSRMGPFPKGKADPPVAVNLQRLIKSAQSQFGIDPAKPSELKPVEIISKVRNLLKELEVVKGTDALSVEAQRNATYNFFALIRATLASKPVLLEHRLSPQVRTSC